MQIVIDAIISRENVMKLFSLIIASLLVAFSSLAQAVDGLVTFKSPHSVSVTMDRVETLAENLRSLHLP
jgi:hypothetical protein